MDAFDADVLIYAVTQDHPLGERVLRLFLRNEPTVRDGLIGVGSVLLLPELLSKPTRDGEHDELAALASVLGRLDLRPVDAATARLSVALAAKYHLRAADAIHLATAVGAGADRFVTNNRRDFSKSIAEVDVTYPTDLPL